ncbi:MAG: malonyl-CoA decarboxylase family protein, partial [Rubrivivax sp.]|nr:malonyl-CoA decarboxylase family protein [Rubrivivax sp.]
MLDELLQAATRQRSQRGLRRLLADCKRLLSEQGDLNGLPLARALIGQLDTLDESQLDGLLDYLASELAPDPAQVLICAQAYADQPTPESLNALTSAAEPPRQELLRRLNRTPGGTAAILRLRRALLRRLPRHPELRALESDLLHLLTSWFNPGFLRLERVDWDSPARLLEKVIQHEAVHEIDGWDDLRRRLRPDRRMFAFFHPQLPGEPLIFVEVALLREMPAAIAPLIDKASEPLAAERFRVAAFYSISNCEPGLRGVSLGNFLIKSVAEHLHSELPQLKTFCTLSPLPGFASWLLADPDLASLPAIEPRRLKRLLAARATLLGACGGDLSALQHSACHDSLPTNAQAALLALGSA